MLLAPCLVIAGALPAAHPDSLSSSLVVIGDGQVSVRLRCQLLSLQEVIADLDQNGDGTVEASELEARSDEVRAYVEAHYRLIVGSGRDLQGGTALVLAAFEAQWLEAGDRTALGGLESGVEFAMRFETESPIEDLLLEVTLFHDTSPDHVDLATVRWPDGATDSFGVLAEQPRVRSDPSGRGVFGLFLRLGVRHILSGWDHLAFVVLLFLGARSTRSLLGVITAFTAAHSITLVAASLGWVNVAPFASYVEMLIALSIAYIGCVNLLGPAGGRARWVETFCFGLIHGLGFAGYLARTLLGEGSKVKGLIAFNLGIEFGQVLVVSALACVALACSRRKNGRQGDTLVTSRVRILGSLPLVGFGLWWFFQRL